jgi:hypothetical protein
VFWQNTISPLHSLGKARTNQVFVGALCFQTFFKNAFKNPTNWFARDSIFAP